MLSNRCCNIIVMLLGSEESVRLKDISKEFSISERAVRYDLEEIDNFLLKYDFDVITKRNSLGVNLPFEENEKQRLLKAIINEREVTSFDTPSARLLEVLLSIALNPGFVFIDKEAERIGVSRSTIFKDFEKIRLLLNRDGVMLTSTVAGYRLMGEEVKVRLNVSRVLLSILDHRDIMEMIHYLTGKEDFSFSDKINKIFGGLEIAPLRKALQSLTESKKGNLKDNTFVFSGIALAIGLKRYRIGYGIGYKEMSAPRGKAISNLLYQGNNKEYLYIDELLSYIENIDGGTETREYFPDLQLLSYNLVQKVSRLSYSIMQSKNLIEVLQEEFLSLIFDTLRRNSKLGEQIDMRETDLAKAIEEEILPLEGILKRKIDNSDIARFYRIFMSENQKNLMEKTRKKVMVLCPFDKTYSKLVSQKLTSMFEVDVFECSGLKSLDRKIGETGAEIVVSTIPLNLTQQKVIKISSGFTQEDLEELRRNMPGRVINSQNIKNIHSIIKAHLGAGKKCNDLTVAIAKELNTPVEFTLSEEPRVTLENISFGSAKDYVDALEIVGRLMVKSSLVTPDYIPAMVLEVEETKTHMVVSEGIVLAHSRRTDLVKSVGAVLLKLDKKVPFTGKNGVPCDLIFAISTTDAESHLNLLGEISDVVSDPAKLKILKSSKKKDEILKLFER